MVTFVARMRMRNAQKNFSRKARTKETTRETAVDGTTILKWILEK
jgi:hypothetical protein